MSQHMFVVLENSLVQTVNHLREVTPDEDLNLAILSLDKACTYITAYNKKFDTSEVGQIPTQKQEKLALEEES